MSSEHIESPRNQRVKDVVRLRNRSERDRTGQFLVEGRAEVVKALNGGLRGRTLYLSGDHPDDRSAADLALSMGVEVVETSATAFGRMAYRDVDSGVLLVAEQFETGLSSLDVKSEPFLLIVESIEKPGNLGTMLRTAEGAGLDAMIVCDPQTDVFNPNVVRASLGTLFWVPLAVASSTDTISWLRARQIRTIASTPAGKTDHHDADFSGSVALVVGAEHDGLSRSWLDEADELVRIPMRGRGDSLNAAASAAVLLYEAVRQRTA